MKEKVFIVDNGTDGIWTYRKWSDGTYDAWVDAAINLLPGTALGGGYYHKSYSALPAPSFSTRVSSVHGSPNGANLVAYLGRDTSTNETYWWNGVANAANAVAVRLEMHGTW